MAPTPKKQEGSSGSQDTKRKIPLGRFDPYVGSISVTGLDRYNFEEFITEKDAVLVMFYDPTGKESDWSKKHFIRAAKTTQRPNHAYGAMDCVKEIDLCKEEDADAPYPVFRLYSRGQLVDTYKDNRSFLFPMMRNFVEKAPLLIEPERPQRSCDIDK